MPDRMTIYKLFPFFLRCLPALLIAAICVQVAAAQGFTTTNPGDIMHQFRSMRTTWMTNVWIFANRLFGVLAIIEFTWSAIVMALDKIGKAARKTDSALRGTHDRLRDARLRLGRLSDAAPQPSPPRMSIDHDND